MQAGCVISSGIKRAFMMQCCTDSQVVYATWGTAAANRRILMRIFCSLIEQYDGSKAAIQYECEGFANSLGRSEESGGKTRQQWQHEGKAIMARISVKQMSRTNIQPSLFSLEGATTAGTTGPGGTPGADEDLRELRKRNVELTKEIGERSYTNSGSTEAFQNQSQSTPKRAEELLKEGLTEDVMAEPDEAAAKIAPVPDAAVPESAVKKSAEEHMTDEKLTDEDHNALAQAINAAGGLGAVAKEREHIKSPLPMTLQRVQAKLDSDLADFDAEKVCWNCASWDMFDKKIGECRDANPSTRLSCRLLLTDPLACAYSGPHEGAGPGAGPDMLACTGCRQAYYCSRECQTQNWDDHRVSCRQQQRLAAKRNNKTGAAESESLQAGDAVILKGLKGAPQHNGKQGIIQEFDGAKSRFVVKLDGTDVSFSLKPENLSRVVPNDAGEEAEPAEDALMRSDDAEEDDADL
jgi:hypothetical protein